MPFTIHDLNPPQQEAVFTTEGPVLILAGAGSGKTRTLTCRVAHLLEQGVAPWNILAITFTNKAAEEMKTRVTDTAPEGDKVWVATFHSTCLRILRTAADRLGYEKDFTIYDTDDSRVLMRRIIKELDYNPKEYRERDVLRRISAWKNKMRSPDDADKLSSGRYGEERVVRLYREYQRRLLMANAMDFDDLLLNAVQLFEDNPDVLEHWRNRFRYVLVDEYQDTNPAQFRFVELLAKEHRNLCVVGDDDQSIYRFRGAEIRNILNFESVFPEAKVIRLEQNYRSTKTILKAANGVIANNAGRKEKTLWSAMEDGDPVVFREYGEAREEARGILQDIQKERDRFDYGDCAVLYRTNAQSRVLEETFVAAGLPYRLIGGVNFYERREIKDCLSYLRLIANPRDDVSLRRIVNVPKRGIGDTTMDRVAEFAAREDLSLLESMTMAADIPGLTKGAAAKLTAFTNLLMSLQMEALSLSVEALIERTLRDTGYLDYLLEEGEIESEARRENLQELVNKAADFGGEIGLDALSQFLSETSLVADVDALEDDVNKVVLMTLHSAKGLEFPKVYMAGMEQQIFPGERVLYSGDDSDLEEERRLCYVGITRAMKKLVLTAAARRMVNGSFQTHTISQFVEEIPKDVLKHERRGLMMSSAGRPGREEGSWRFGSAGDDEWSPRGRSGWGSGAGASGSWSSGSGRASGGNSSGGWSSGGSRISETARPTSGKQPAPGWTDFGDSFGFGVSARPGKPAAPAPEILTEFAPGDRVVSRRFGAGTVEKTEQTSRETTVTVLFDKFGRKVLLPEYAALTREE